MSTQVFEFINEMLTINVKELLTLIENGDGFCVFKEKRWCCVNLSRLAQFLRCSWISQEANLHLRGKSRSFTMSISGSLSLITYPRWRVSAGKDKQMTTLYACLASGNCMKPWLAMTQLGYDFELVLVDVLKGEQRAPAYLWINPLGVVPYLITPDGQGIGESNAMLWYIAEGSALMPANREDRAEALQWMFFEQSKLEPFISPARFYTHILPQHRVEKAQDIARWQSLAKPGLARLNAHLSEREFVVKSGYSIADISLFGYVHVLE